MPGTELSIVTANVPGGIMDYATLISTSKKSFEVVAIREGWVPKEHLSSVFLQYCGYGYAKRGAPLWLVKTIEQHRSKIGRLGVFFHELYAFGPPWSSAFWLSPLQKYIVRRLAELSDFWMTNRALSAEWLQPLAGNKPHAVLPIFSNVGELELYTNARSKKVVVFGGQALRAATYRGVGEEFFSNVLKEDYTIHDIGAEIVDAEVCRLLKRNGVMVHGRLDPKSVSELLADAMFGIVKYPTQYLAKSSVFAAYSAHGVAPIVVTEESQEVDGLKRSFNYFHGESVTSLSQLDFEGIGKSAWLWYQPHSITRHISSLSALCGLEN